MRVRDPQSQYSMLLEWDPEDRIFVVTVPELPGCRTHGRTYGEAVRQGQAAMESWLEAAEVEGAPIPTPGPATAETATYT